VIFDCVALDVNLLQYMDVLTVLNTLLISQRALPV